jgi:N6-L-threonylcarbamoyladenine synthase
MKICLGIESTAHTIGFGLVTFDGKVLANVNKGFVTDSGGMIPFQVAEHHVKVFDELLDKALVEADVKLQDVSLISFSQSPGIGHCLRIGAMIARSISAIYDIPIVGINHCIAHLEIGRLLTDAKDPILLYASGANTQVIAYEGGKYRIFGETLDIGIGNFFDTFARELGLGFPCGPKVRNAAVGGKMIELPYCVKGMDIVLGGLLTNLKQKIGKFPENDLCYSTQETAFAMLVEVAERAMAHCGKNELLLGGGVACDDRLQEMCKDMCEARGAKLFVPARQFLVDNAAMIAWQGVIEFKSGTKMKVSDCVIKPYLRTDEIVVNWRK